MRVLVTGGCGFIGSHLVRYLLRQFSVDSSAHSSSEPLEVLNLDKLTYAAGPHTLADIEKDSRYHFRRGDVADAELLAELFDSFRPHAVIHLAAESHVDRSIDGPEQFIQTNLVGTFRLLSAALKYWTSATSQLRSAFRLLHVSTDEVFGSLGETGLFSETTRYDPHSPYAASKAGADHLVRAWHTTYGLPTIVTNCSNNYGPNQFPEKLIPLTIIRAVRGQGLPVYGTGSNVRDWLFVEDHVAGLAAVLVHGQVGDTYNLGGNCQMTNIDLVHQLCDLLDELHPRPQGSYRQLIEFVVDRPGHDFRYAIDSSKIQRELGWKPTHTLSSGLRRTIQWYLQNTTWWKNILDSHYQLERLGTCAPKSASAPKSACAPKSASEVKANAEAGRSNPLPPDGEQL